MNEAADLLLDMARALHAAALPADEVERRFRAMAQGLGLTAQVLTLQSFVAAELRDDGTRRVEIRRIPFDTHWNLRRLGELTALSRQIAERRISIAGANATLGAITTRPNRYSKPLVVLAYAVYGAAVAARVGGSALEMLVAAVLGLVAGAIHFGTLASTTIDLQKSFLAAFAGTLCVFAATFVLPPFDAGRAIFGGVTLLVPAMVITIGLHELAAESLESGVSRLAYGLLRFLMLAFGIGGAVSLAKIIGPWPAQVTATALPMPVTLLAVAAGGLALVACLQGRPRDIPWMVLAAVLAYGVQEATKLLVGGRGSPFVAAFVIGAVAYLHARLPGNFRATIIVPGLLQLAPGFLGTQAVFQLLQGGSATDDASFFDVLMVALQLGTGLLVAGLVFQKPVERSPRTIPV
jgi:uncharacterized membrane protein YjjP (DUF1212 family)